MNPDTNKFEPLFADAEQLLKEQYKEQVDKLHDAMGLMRQDGSPVPEHWSTFAIDELVVIKNYNFRVRYIGETAILFEPVGPVVIGEETP